MLYYSMSHIPFLFILFHCFWQWMVFKFNIFLHLPHVLVPSRPWFILSDHQRVATVILWWTRICHKHCNCTILVWVPSNPCVCLLHRRLLVFLVSHSKICVFCLFWSHQLHSLSLFSLFVAYHFLVSADFQRTALVERYRVIFVVKM